MPCTLDVEINLIGGDDVDIVVSTDLCETQLSVESIEQNLTLEIIDAPMGGGGPSGGSAFTRTAGTAISALVAVYELPDGTVWPLSADDDDHIDLLAGITLTSAGTGAEVTVQRAGPLDAAGLNLQPGRVWLGMNGQLTQTPPDSGNDTLLGYATAEQRLYIDISETILLED